MTSWIISFYHDLPFCKFGVHTSYRSRGYEQVLKIAFFRAQDEFWPVFQYVKPRTRANFQVLIPCASKVTEHYILLLFGGGLPQNWVFLIFSITDDDVIVRAQNFLDSCVLLIPIFVENFFWKFWLVQELFTDSANYKSTRICGIYFPYIKRRNLDSAESDSAE